jgi:hypothetical protein
VFSIHKHFEVLLSSVVFAMFQINFVALRSKGVMEVSLLFHVLSLQITYRANSWVSDFQLEKAESARRFHRFLTMVYNTQNYWVFGHFSHLDPHYQQ